MMRSDATDPLLEIALEAAASHLENLFSKLRYMAPACSSKRFAATRKNYMAMVPEKARVGDLVCVMHGCETPFVLRRKGSRPSKSSDIAAFMASISIAQLLSPSFGEDKPGPRKQLAFRQSTRLNRLLIPRSSGPETSFSFEDSFRSTSMCY